MDIFSLFKNNIFQFWPLVLILAVAFFLKSSWFKGKIGEYLVNRALVKLPSSDYSLAKNVTLPTNDGSTQIDHIVVSRFGIFVIETKNMKGWIFGSEKQRLWTQKIYRHTSKFQNPLHQNYKHLKALESLLAVDSSTLHSMVVFVGDSTFKTEMPANVTYAYGCIEYIKSFEEELFASEDIPLIVDRLNSAKLKPGVITDLKHRNHVKDIVSGKEDIQICPRCHSDMVLRVSKKGLNAGQQFWGCSEYPKCKSIVKYDEIQHQRKPIS